MSPEISRTQRNTPTRLSSEAGLTLIGLLVAVVVSGIFLAGLTSFFSRSTQNYSAQRQLLENQQGAQTTIEELTEALMQAGANIPSVDTAVLLPNTNGDTIHLRVNPNGAEHLFVEGIIAQTIDVGDAKLFMDESHLVHLHNTYPPVFEDLYVDTTYTTGDFVEGVDTVNNKIHLTTTPTFYTRDLLYVKKPLSYYLDYSSNQVKIVDTDGTEEPLADNVDTLRVRFFDSDGNQTMTWFDAVQCSLSVTVKAPTSSINYSKHSDGKRRLTMKRQFHFRNKRRDQ